MSINYSIIKTKLGFFGLAFNDNGIIGTVLPKPEKMEVQMELAKMFKNSKEEYLVQKKPEPKMEKIFQNYFSGKKVDLTNLPVDVTGTDFEKNVWAACLAIPYGEVRSYGWIAEKINRKKASRAVGNALGKNPVAPIVPCHRVIGNDNLGGYSSGLSLKRKMLELEHSSGFRLF
ncbi:MAG: methylated-DNA--[protein]-cysteine S-methyltransferase [Candidatus Woesearchaeota archaeon]